MCIEQNNLKLRICKRTLAFANELEEPVLVEHDEAELVRVRQLLRAGVASGHHMRRFARHTLRHFGAEPLEQLFARVALDALEHSGHNDAHTRQAIRPALTSACALLYKERERNPHQYASV